ncbi:MAG TPA: hypothetical protein VFP93_02015, partial [Gammaproteobacteria bacterium]|nr:hypothetical protein [Gammaproteobacteria bacterium]
EIIMKLSLTFIGIAFLILGVISLGYQGFTYTQEEKVAEIGSFKVTEQKEKSIPIPPIVGGVSIIIGIILVIQGSRKKP